MGRRLHRLRHRCSSLEVSEPRPALNLLKLLCLLRELAKICLKRRRVRCRRLRATTADPKRPQGDLRATNRQDSTGAAAMAGPSISRIKKIIFSPPSKCPIDLFGPVSNRTILRRLHGASRSSSRNPRLSGADGSYANGRYRAAISPKKNFTNAPGHGDDDARFYDRQQAYVHARGG